LLNIVTYDGVSEIALTMAIYVAVD
jgi:hypothetical protein